MHITYRVNPDSYGNRFFITSVSWLSKQYLGSPRLIETTRIGDQKIVDAVDCQFVLQDGERVWSDGFIERVPNYYKDMLISDELDSHDICYYCGADNGPNGEWRVGWDCHYCQSN